MDGLVVTDLSEVSSCAKVISVGGEDKKMLEFKVSSCVVELLETISLFIYVQTAWGDNC